jgi:hypothetical protein
LDLSLGLDTERLLANFQDCSSGFLSDEPLFVVVDLLESRSAKASIWISAMWELKLFASSSRGDDCANVVGKGSFSIPA